MLQMIRSQKNIKNPIREVKSWFFSSQSKTRPIMLNIQEGLVHDIQIYRLEGSFHGAYVKEFQNLVLTAVRAGRSNLLLDFSQVDFIDSTGMSLLVILFKTVAKAQGQLALVGVAPMIRQVLSITRLDRLFEMYEDEASALAAIHNQQCKPSRFSRNEGVNGDGI